MEFATLSDPVEVGVRFGERGMRPVWFLWQGRRRMIRDVTCVWSERDGRQLHHYFAVTDGQALYELCFEVGALRWRLTKIALA